MYRAYAEDNGVALTALIKAIENAKQKFEEKMAA
jgi:hypothetical protein